MLYADYTYYTDEYHGISISEKDYPRLALKASAYIDGLIAVTEPVADAVKNACCSVAEAVQINEQGGEVVNANNDGYSETYVATAMSKAQRLYDAAALFLWPTGVISAWV